MKKELSTLPLVLFIIASCKKGNDAQYTKEEFIDFSGLQTKGWALKNNSSAGGAGDWHPGYVGVDKSGRPYGFRAYSYKDEEYEYAYAGFVGYPGNNIVISSWLISPELEITSNATLSFFVHGDNGNGDVLEVRMNDVDNTTDVGNTPTSIGKFTKLLKVIKAPPYTWQKIIVNFSDVSTSRYSRIAFRYVPDPTNSKGVGIDVFEFKSK